MCDKSTLHRQLLKAISIARVREPKMRLLCDNFWIKKLKFLKRKVLIRIFKFTLGNCNFSTIYAIFKKGLLSNDCECLKFAQICVQRRNLSTESSRVLEILGGNKSLRFFCQNFFSLSWLKIFFFLNHKSRVWLRQKVTRALHLN